MQIEGKCTNNYELLYKAMLLSFTKKTCREIMVYNH